MGKLESQLQSYAAGPLYPMHMPGHKRRLSPGGTLPCGWDMTEVEGVDDLHDTEGILKDAMERTAALHGAARTWYLVNGSTCGLLAGIRALVRPGSKILVARNCHKAVYHAIELGNLHAHYLLPPTEPLSGIYGSVRPRDVEAMLDTFPKTACVVLTSPTYEGVISDIRAIARICHDRQIPLLVDEAHGAHLGLFPGWPDSAVHQGADLVVQSAHKTLPSLTQTALLHMPSGSLADPEEVDRQLDIFETSSPSYPLMASLDGCTELLTTQGAELFSRWLHTLREFDKKAGLLKSLQVLGHSPKGNPACFYDFDMGKLPIFCGQSGYTAASLAAALRNTFHFETEMACGYITLAMTSPADSQEAILRFGDALLALDQQAASCTASAPLTLPEPGRSELPIGQALCRKAVHRPLTEAEGRICAEYIWAYPPGVPLTVPGERITHDFLNYTARLRSSGTRLHHSHCKKPGFIQVLA